MARDSTGEEARRHDRAHLCALLHKRLLPIARNDLPEHAEDLVQTAVMRVLKEIDKARPEGISSLMAYAYQVYRHALADALREEVPRRRWTGLDGRERSLADVGARPDRAVEQRERMQILRTALARLKPKYRAVIALRYVEEKSYEEIAEILGLPMGTVGSRLSEARTQLIRIATRLRK